MQSANGSVVLLLSPDTKKLGLGGLVGYSARCSSVAANASNAQVSGPHEGAGHAGTGMPA